MNRLFSALLLIPCISFAAPFDLLIRQQNIAATAIFERVVPLPSGLNVNAVLGIDQFTNLPVMYGLGDTMGVLEGNLVANLDWLKMYNKPTFSLVATSGSYSDLIGKPSLASVATSGAYSDLSGAPVVPPRSQSSAARDLDTAFQVSYVRDAMVIYSVQCTITANIPNGQSCDVVLEIASDDAFTENVQTVGVIGTGQTYTMVAAIQGVQPQTAQITGYIPAGYYARLRTVNVSGSPTYAYRAGQEILQ